MAGSNRRWRTSRAIYQLAAPPAARRQQLERDAHLAVARTGQGVMPDERDRGHEEELGDEAEREVRRVTAVTGPGIESEQIDERQRDRRGEGDGELVGHAPQRHEKRPALRAAG
jgi:hypothetical protein